MHDWQPAVCLDRFLQNVEDFDAAIYSISPPEAVVLDPQHRLMLEVNSLHIL